LADLGVVKTHSRPHVSNDNAFSESQFKTMKYRPEFPDRFGSLQDARAFGHVFFPWYNDEHHHGALGFLTPAVVHYGLADAIRQKRTEILKAAYSAHPERFVKGSPEPAALPPAVWINPPQKKTPLQIAPQSTIVTADDLRLDRTSPTDLSNRTIARSRYDNRDA
jgi:putative transposase